MNKTNEEGTKFPAGDDALEAMFCRPFIGSGKEGLLDGHRRRPSSGVISRELCAPGSCPGARQKGLSEPVQPLSSGRSVNICEGNFSAHVFVYGRAKAGNDSGTARMPAGEHQRTAVAAACTAAFDEGLASSAKDVGSYCSRTECHSCREIEHDAHVPAWRTIPPVIISAIKVRGQTKKEE